MDLFDIKDLPEPFSSIQAPDFNKSFVKPLRISFPYSQDAKKLTLVDVDISLESSWDNYIIQLSDLPSSHFLNYFSKKHLREKISALTLQINQNAPEEISKKKREANPYTLLKKSPGNFRYPGVTRMANILKLFPELIDKNFLISDYRFLVLGDKGGYSEFLSNAYRDKFLDEPIGYALFPRHNFKIDNITIRNEGEINFESIEKVSEEILEDCGEPSLMLIVSDMSWKEKDCNTEEKYMKLYLAYSMYMSVKLLAKGGNLVVKLYNSYHPATIELIYIIASMFTSVSMIKLLSSSPHSNSRIIVALDFKSNTDFSSFYDLCKVLERLLHMEKDLEHVLAFDKVLDNNKFQDYIMNQNSAIAESQILALSRMLEHLDGQKPIKIDKEEVCEKCLLDWKLIDSTEEEQKEKFIEQTYTDTQMRTVSSIRSERPPDISGIKDIIYRNAKNNTDIKLRNSARKRPEDIAPERTFDLQQFVKVEDRPVEDLRFFKPKSARPKKK